MIDLEKLRERVSGNPDDDGAIGPTWCKPSEVLALLDYISQLEKDAARLDYMIQSKAIVVTNIAGKCWLEFPLEDASQIDVGNTPREAIDSMIAMEAKHG